MTIALGLMGCNHQSHDDICRYSGAGQNAKDNSCIIHNSIPIRIDVVRFGPNQSFERFDDDNRFGS
jgi:hypothetical protein